MIRTRDIGKSWEKSGMDLYGYDLVVISSSAGKDSQSMLDWIVGLADQQDYDRSNLVVVHADLGRVEWKGTRKLAERQARAYDLRFEVVSREQDLLDHVRGRGRWPDNKNRYCTSDHKRDQIAKVYTRLVKELRTSAHGAVTDRPVRILECLGIRAQESSGRAKKNPFQRNKRASNGRRIVDTWFPIFDWTEKRVWNEIEVSGVPHHRAYDLGMPRLSCVFCVFAPKSALLIAGKHNPELLDAYCDAEEEMGHTFRQDFRISEIRDELTSGAGDVLVTVDEAADWNM